MNNKGKKSTISVVAILITVVVVGAAIFFLNRYQQSANLTELPLPNTTGVSTEGVIPPDEEGETPLIFRLSEGVPQPDVVAPLRFYERCTAWR